MAAGGGVPEWRDAAERYLHVKLAAIESAKISQRRAPMQSILIIDDDAHLRDTVAVLLEQEGFQVAQAADGRSGLDRALTMKPDLLLVDLRLPALSGMELCKQLRSSNIRIPIIVLSAV